MTMEKMSTVSMLNCQPKPTHKKLPHRGNQVPYEVHYRTAALVKSLPIAMDIIKQNIQEIAIILSRNITDEAVDIRILQDRIVWTCEQLEKENDEVIMALQDAGLNR